MTKDCKTCVHDGMQMFYPSGCTGCGADGERLNYIAASEYKTLSAFEQVELQKQLATVTAERDRERALNDKLVESYEKADFEIRKLEAEREEREKQEPVAFIYLDESNRLYIIGAGAQKREPVANAKPLFRFPPVPDGKVLVDVKDLEALACLGNGDKWGSSIGNQMAQAMLKAAQQGE